MGIKTGAQIEFIEQLMRITPPYLFEICSDLIIGQLDFERAND
jgi:hypothetical protein